MTKAAAWFARETTKIPPGFAAWSGRSCATDWILSEYARYYNCAHTHLAFEKDAPERRRVQVQGRELGRVIAFPEACELHHRYECDSQREA